jgi:SAM-dependent methyltransferase
MEFTGERMIPAQVDIELELEHKNRYYFAQPLVRGMRVLDAACGAGYGSQILAQTAQAVVGIDISDETVVYAQQHYGGDNIAFQQASVTELPFEAHTFDAVVSFETLEHVTEAQQQTFMREIKRVLRPDGLLVMSTPNKDIYQEKVENHFHEHELDAQEFEALLKTHFKEVVFVAQQFEIGNVITPAGQAPATVQNDFHMDAAEYLIAVCCDRALGPVEARVLVRESGTLAKLTQWAVSTDRLSEERMQHIRRLDGELEEKDGLIRRQDTQISERNAHIQRQDQEIRQRDGLISEKDGLIGEKETLITQQATQLAEKEVLLDQRTNELREVNEELHKYAWHLTDLIAKYAALDNEHLSVLASRTWRFSHKIARMVR